MAAKQASKEHHLRLYDSLLDSPAYLDLKPPARALLIEFLRIYRPSINGRLSISTREATERLNVTEPVALKAYYELAEHGFIRLKNHESWIDRKAREWELTMLPVNNHEPRNDWMQWTKGANLCPLPTKKKKSRPMKTGAVLPMKSRAAMAF
ncbi:hypothetical protein [Thiothrix unzii]|jgi:hypothetical protein|uniref:hypothetical protein n=1 Tax=Thiothrix unzii TaxID=111769 RepID=UPI002A358901|nr:hypothetical protein [Thiothrix unzii]MDX9989013.1 hypothetical protein [Thiothrix unzii]